MSSLGESVALAGFLPAWDVERRHADVGALVTWTLAELRRQGIDVPRLEDIHHALDSGAAPAMAQHLTGLSTGREPRRALHALVRALLPELPWARIAIQATVHLRILVPGDAVSPVPLHTDFGIGHSLDERNIWIALTPALGNAALHVSRLTTSIASDERRRAAGQLLIDPETPVHAFEAERGDALLFTPLHVHGARIVDGDQTRVSIDVRIAPIEASRARNPYAYIPLVPLVESAP